MKSKKIIAFFMAILVLLSGMPNTVFAALEKDRIEYGTAMFKGPLNMKGKPEVSFIKSDGSKIGTDNMLTQNDGNDIGVRASFNLENIDEIIDQVSQGKIPGLPSQIAGFIPMFKNQAIIRGSFDLEVDLNEALKDNLAINSTTLDLIKANPNSLLELNPSYGEVFNVESIDNINNVVKIVVSMKDGVTGKKILDLKNEFSTLDMNFGDILTIDSNIWNKVNDTNKGVFTNLLKIKAPETVFLVDVPQDLINMAAGFGVNIKNPFVGVQLKMDEGNGSLNLGYTVTFNSNGGSDVESQVVNYKGKASVKNPTKDNATFGGWYSDEGLTEKFELSTEITEDKTLYAKWDVIEENNLTVTFKPNGGKFGESTGDKIVQVESGKPVESQVVTREGHDFDAWYSDEALTEKYDFTKVVTENLNLYAGWKANVFHKVEFITTKGTAPVPKDVAHGDKVEEPKPLTSANDAFKGWYLESSFKTLYDFNTPVVADMKLYAKWNTIRTITYRPQGGVFEDGSTSNTHKKVEDGEFAPELVVTKEGHKFLGWFKGDTELYDFTKPVDSAASLFAHWEKLPDTIFTITFDSKGGTPVEQKIVNSGGLVEKPTDPTLEGKDFKGWFTDETYNTEWNFDTDVVTKSMTLYAKWDDKPVQTEKYEWTIDWLDGNVKDGWNLEGIRPVEVKAQVITRDRIGAGNEKPVEGLFLTLSGISNAEQWAGTFDLPKLSDNSREYYLKMDKAQMPNYSINKTEMDRDGTGRIIRFRTQLMVQIFDKSNITVIWDDGNNQDGKRPKSINGNIIGKIDTPEGTIYRDSRSFRVSEAQNAVDENTWFQTQEFERYNLGYLLYDISAQHGLPKGYTQGIPIVESKQVGDNWIYDITITNKYTPETIDIEGTKTWDDNDDQDGVRPDEIKVKLFADGNKVTDKKLTVTKDANTDPTNANKWNFKWEGLPKYSNGKVIKYTIGEEKVDKYDTKINNFDITNTYSPKKIEVSVEKVWNDANNQDGKRPTEIEVQLTAGGTDVAGKTLALNAGNNWTGTFAGLDEKANGANIVYSVKEVAVPTGYTPSVADINNGKVVVTNSYDIETIDINGVKTWNDRDDKAGKRPDSIVVELLANGDTVNGKTITVNKTQVDPSDANKWNYSWNGLPKYKDGQVITYTVREQSVNEYSPVYDGLDITNTYDKRFSVNYDGNGNNGGIVPVTETYDSGETITVADAVTKDDNIFRGWQDQNGNVYQAGDTFVITENMTLVAKWEVEPPKPGTLEVRYYGNGNTSGTAPEDNNKYLSGERVTVKGENTLANDNHKFLGWSTTRNGSVVYRPGETFTINNNIDLYAVWDRNFVDYSSIIWNWHGEKETPTSIHRAYLKGYPDGSIKPQGKITRGEVAAVISRLMEDKEEIEYSVDSKYSDINPTDWYAKHIAYVSDKGIMKGYENGTFKPEENITRAEYATVIARFNKLDSVETTFADSSSHWANGYIGAVAKKKWINGYPDGTFKPAADISREEVVAMTNRMLDRSIDEHSINDLVISKFVDVEFGTWSYYDLIEASNSHEYIRRSEHTSVENWKKVLD